MVSSIRNTFCRFPLRGNRLDNVGNRTDVDGTSYVPNNLNQYSSVNAVSFTYDGNGNLTSDGNNAYIYDDSNRLTSANNLAAEYEYDALNRRTEKTVGSATTNYVYSGDTVIAEYDDAGNLLREYVQGSRIDEILTMDRLNSTYFYYYDGLGSVTNITDANGNIIESYTYDAYGQPSITTSGIDNPYRFTGRRFDEETGIYHYRARKYDPLIGRFLQRDPISIAGGINLYAYVLNNPTNLVDPLGLRGNFSDNFQFSLNANNDFFFGGITRFSRTAIGALTAGTVARESGLMTFGSALNSYLYNVRTYAPELGMASFGVALRLGGAVVLNSLYNSALVTGAVEVGVLGGSLLDATFQTFFVEDETDVCK